MVVVWAVRLGPFLFRRIHRAGKDDRFTQIKPSFIRFLNAWTLQGLWVSFTVGAALVGITTAHRKPLDAFALIGLLIWLLGFGIEVLADAQKTRFSADPATGGIHRAGLWALRHPSYVGEIVSRQRVPCWRNGPRSGANQVKRKSTPVLFPDCRQQPARGGPRQRQLQADHMELDGARPLPARVTSERERAQ
jgi:hypothetical protein